MHTAPKCNCNKALYSLYWYSLIEQSLCSETKFTELMLAKMLGNNANMFGTMIKHNSLGENFAKRMLDFAIGLCTYDTVCMSMTSCTICN